MAEQECSECSEQIEAVTGKISLQFQEHLLGAIFQKTERKAKGIGKLLQAIWEKDEEERKSFWKDQNWHVSIIIVEGLGLKRIFLSKNVALLRLASSITLSSSLTFVFLTGDYVL